MSAGGLGNPMERKVVSQRASRPLGVPQSSMGSSPTTSKTAWATLPILNSQRQNTFDTENLQPPTVQAIVLKGKYRRQQLQRRKTKAIDGDPGCSDSWCSLSIPV